MLFLEIFNFLSMLFYYCKFLFFFFPLFYILIPVIKLVCILIAVAYFTIAERKVTAAIQRRLGPNIEGGPFGLIQPIADGLKLFIKEFIIPSHANIFLFMLSPLLIFTLSMSGWAVIPFYFSLIYVKSLNVLDVFGFFNLVENFMIGDTSFGLMFILALSSLNVYGIILGGWSSNSKYAFLGALRSASQMISYEVSIGLTLLPVVILTGSFNLTDIVLMQSKTIWFIFPLLPCFIIFFVSMLAETNRAPFDSPEAEAELVAGYNVEYGSMAFALYFMGEYSSMLLMSTLIVLLFCGGWLMPFFNFNVFNFMAPVIFSIKIAFFCFCYILVRAAFPRYRYDQLMDIGWKIFLPFTLSFLIFIVSFLLIFSFLPLNYF